MHDSAFDNFKDTITEIINEPDIIIEGNKNNRILVIKKTR